MALESNSPVDKHAIEKWKYPSGNCIIIQPGKGVDVTGVKESLSSAHKSSTNSIEWQHRAYQELQVLKEKFGQELKKIHHRTKERCLQPSCSAQERSKLENGARFLEKMYAFLSMPKALLANYPKVNFVHNSKYIIGFLKNQRPIHDSVSPICQTSNDQNPSRQQQLGREGSRTRHVGRHDLQCQNILPIFNAQRIGPPQGVSLLPQPSDSASPITILPHPRVINNHEKILTKGIKRSNMEPAVEHRDYPVGQDRLSSQSNQGGLANCNVSFVSALPNHPQRMNPNGSCSEQSQTSASVAIVAPSCGDEYHVESSTLESQHDHAKNTDGTRDVSHQNDDIHETEVVPCPVSVAKRQKTEVVANLVLQEIKTINRRLIETVVDVKEQMTDATHGGEGLILEFTFSAVGQKRSPNLMHDPFLMLPDLLLQVVVSDDYPNFSPRIVDRNPQPWSENDLALWNKSWQKFDRAIRKLVQPISLIELAKAWDASAHEACLEYAIKLGGGCFSSKYGKWEKCTI